MKFRLIQKLNPNSNNRNKYTNTKMKDNKLRPFEYKSIQKQ